MAQSLPCRRGFTRSAREAAAQSPEPRSPSCAGMPATAKIFGAQPASMLNIALKMRYLVRFLVRRSSVHYTTCPTCFPPQGVRARTDEGPLSYERIERNNPRRHTIFRGLQLGKSFLWCGMSSCHPMPGTEIFPLSRSVLTALPKPHLVVNSSARAQTDMQTKHEMSGGSF